MKNGTESIDWKEIGNLVYEILRSIRLQREELKPELRRRGINLEQLRASAIIEAIRERIEQAESPG
jgi:hypothetical protein